jgi:Transglycosylase SLT domain
MMTRNEYSGEYPFGYTATVGPPPMTRCAISFRLTYLVALTLWSLHAGAEPSVREAKPRCSGTSVLCELVGKEAERVGLDPALVDAVIKVESDYRPEAIGTSGEIGLMQVLPSTARLLGFNGTEKELADPATNIRLGVTYLAEAWNLAHGDLCRSLMKYRAGHGEERMTPLSLEYCRRAREYLTQTGQITNGKDIRLPSKPQLANSPVPPIDRRLKGAAFWAAQKARVEAITALVHERWARIAKNGRI